MEGDGDGDGEGGVRGEEGGGRGVGVGVMRVRTVISLLSAIPCHPHIFCFRNVGWTLQPRVPPPQGPTHAPNYEGYPVPTTRNIPPVAPTAYGIDRSSEPYSPSQPTSTSPSLRKREDDHADEDMYAVPIAEHIPQTAPLSAPAQWAPRDRRAIGEWSARDWSAGARQGVGEAGATRWSAGQPDASGTDARGPDATERVGGQWVAQQDAWERGAKESGGGERVAQRDAWERGAKESGGGERVAQRDAWERGAKESGGGERVAQRDAWERGAKESGGGERVAQRDAWERGAKESGGGERVAQRDAWERGAKESGGGERVAQRDAWERGAKGSGGGERVAGDGCARERSAEQRGEQSPRQWCAREERAGPGIAREHGVGEWGAVKGIAEGPGTGRQVAGPQRDAGRDGGREVGKQDAPIGGARASGAAPRSPSSSPSVASRDGFESSAKASSGSLPSCSPPSDVVSPSPLPTPSPTRSSSPSSAGSRDSGADAIYNDILEPTNAGLVAPADSVPLGPEASASFYQNAPRPQVRLGDCMFK